MYVANISNVIKSFIKKGFYYLCDIIFPRSCLVCNKVIYNGFFCPYDWLQLRFISQPCCLICSYPLKKSESLYCILCVVRKPSYNRSFSLFIYNSVSKHLILNIKYFDKTYLAKYLSNLIFLRFKKVIPDFDYIVPVPLNTKKLRKRKYNQSLLLAKHFSKLSKKRYFYDCLIRKNNDVSQIFLSKKDRNKNTKKAFFVKPKYKNLLKNKNILLIDDVITTGSTVNNCSNVLRANKVNNIFVVTVAKTLIPT